MNDDLFEQTHQRCLDIAFVLVRRSDLRDALIVLRIVPGASCSRSLLFSSSLRSMGSYISGVQSY